MRSFNHSSIIILVLLFLFSCSPNRETELKPALDSITAEGLMSHIKILASDEFEGRAPGSKGEDLTVEYLISQFKQIGLEPGNSDGSYIQNVPLAGLSAQPTAWFVSGKKRMKLENLKDYVAVTRRFVTKVNVDNSDIVFVGYGVVAPEYGWDDYKDVDVKGKTIVMLINDPAVPDPNDPSKLDESLFKGKAMTYYGRWTYKYEIATQKGAAAAIIVHETGPAGYPFEVVSGSWGRENFDIQTPDKNMGRVAVESWITLDVAKKLFSDAGRDFDEMKKAARQKEFRPVALGSKATFHINNTMREIQSKNVVAKLEGSDPGLKNEYLVYTAHWDHFGKDEKAKWDQIYNGALDNASGTSALIEVAKALTKLPVKPKRSVLFLAVTAEEQGLLGAKYYGTNPLYPLSKTLANINIDGLNQWGRTKDYIVIGYGNTTLEDLLTDEARTQGRVIMPDAEPEKGFYYRSDHFEFAKQGVPALHGDAGIEYIGKPAGYGQEKRDEYTNNDYHKPSDEIKPDWDLSGAVEDVRLLLKLGYNITQGTEWPSWKAGTEFKALREEMLKKETSR